jgi:hypothetical protein
MPIAHKNNKGGVPTKMSRLSRLGFLGSRCSSKELVAKSIEIAARIHESKNRHYRRVDVYTYWEENQNIKNQLNKFYKINFNEKNDY